MLLGSKELDALDLVEDSKMVAKVNFKNPGKNYFTGRDIGTMTQIRDYPG